MINTTELSVLDRLIKEYQNVRLNPDGNFTEIEQVVGEIRKFLFTATNTQGFEDAINQ